VLIQALLGGLVFGLYFTLIGLGLNLVFGVMRIVNLAQGGFVMLGAYAGFWAWSLFRLQPVYSAVGVLLAFMLLGFPLYYLVVPRLQLAKNAEMLSLILFFGLSQMIEAAASIAFGATERSIPSIALGFRSAEVLGQRLPSAWLVSAAVSAVAVLLVYLYLYRTRLGTLTRAVMVSREEAVATGIDVDPGVVGGGGGGGGWGVGGGGGGGCGGVRAVHVRQRDASNGGRDQRSGVCGHCRRHAGQPARHRAGRRDLWRFVDADADVSQFVGEPAAQPAADRGAAGPAERPVGATGAECIGRLPARLSRFY